MADKDILLLDPTTGSPSCRKSAATMVDQQTIVGTIDAATPFRVNYSVVAAGMAGSGLKANGNKLEASLVHASGSASSGAGTVASPLLVTAGGGSGITAVSHDTTLTGNGAATPLSVVTASVAQAIAGTNITYNSSTGKLDGAAGAAGAAGSKSTVSGAPPASAAEGDLWHTTAGTSAPYAKNSTYAFISGQWTFIAGYANAEASVALTANGLASPVAQIVNTGTLTINTLNATSSPSGIVVPASGVYEVHVQLNPGTTCTTNASYSQFGYGLRIFANGSEVFANFTPLNALNLGVYSNGTWGAAMQCSNTAFFNAGTTIRFEVYASNCVVNGAANARVSFRSRGGL